MRDLRSWGRASVGVAAMLLSGCEDVRVPADLGMLEYREIARFGGSGAEGAYALGSVQSAALLRDRGAVAVVDALVQEIRIFTLLGNYEATVGRRGPGPGEFLAIRGVSSLSGGRLAVWDLQPARVTVFGPDLAVAHTAAADLSATRSLRPALVDFIPGGGFLLRDKPWHRTRSVSPTGMHQDTVRILRYDAAGQIAGTVVQREDAPRWGVRGATSWGLYDFVFGRTLFAVVAGHELVVGENGTATLDRYRLDGTHLGPIRLPLSARAVTEAEIAEERQRLIDEAPRRPTREVPPQVLALSERQVEFRREVLREVASHDTAPVFDRMIGTAGGGLWIRETPRPARREVRWLRVDPSHSVAGYIPLDRESRMLDGDVEHIVVLERDPFDADVVRILRR